MKKRFALLGGLVITTLCVSSAFAPASTFAADVPLPLNEQALKHNIIKRVVSVFAARNIPNAPSLQQLSPDIITIDKKQAIQLGESTLYAVKVKVANPMGTNGMPDTMTLVVDPSGTYQHSQVAELATGAEAVLAKATDVTRLDLPAEFVSPLTMGTGDHEVVFVSDAFCPYCREAFAFLNANLDKIGTLKTVHLPMVMHAGADAASWIMEYAHAKNINPMEVAKYAYTELPTPAQGTQPDEARKQVAAAMTKAFPELLAKGQTVDALLQVLSKEYQGRSLLTLDAMSKLGITGTPLITINGTPIRGFDKEGIARALGRSVVSQ